MTREEAYNRIDVIIAKYEIDDEYVTITSFLDYDALRMARKLLEQEPCDDAISRQAVLDIVNNPLNIRLDEIIKKLPSVNPQEPKWIPVSERLPEYGEDVITVNSDDDYEINHIIDDDLNKWFYGGVVAWMPLPEPYKAQEGEVSDADSD